MIDRLVEALARAGGTHTIHDVLDQCQEGKARMWHREGAVIVTEVYEYPQTKVIHFWLAGGELKSVIALSREVLDWARANGCKRATLAGRKGWTKALASEAWHPELVLMGKEL